MRNRNAVSRWGGLIQRLVLAPYSVWALLFIVVPLFFVAYYAFTDDAFRFTTANITRFFTATSRIKDGDEFREIHTYLVIFGRSLRLALISTIICLLFGYPFAYLIARSSAKTQSILITIIMIPMWMNFLIRTYAWMTILQDTGLLLNGLRALNGFWERLGWTFLTVNVDNIHITGTETAVIIGMVYDYFPYMILPIYSIMGKMDVKLLEAASDLGCNGFGVLRRVIFPLSLPGVISGVIMVLIPSISTFYISKILGNGLTTMIGDVIESQYQSDRHFASALAFILMVILLIAMALMQRFANKRAAA